MFCLKCSLLYFSVDASPNHRPGFLEQGRLLHRANHLAEAAHGYRECQLFLRYERTGRRVEHPDEAPAAAHGVLFHGESHDTATARGEAGAHCVVIVVVVKRP